MEGAGDPDPAVDRVIPLVESGPAVVVSVVTMWLGWSLATGYCAHRLPVARLDVWRRRLALRSWERGGRVYERVGIRRWKDALPEAGALFRGGVSKRRIPSTAAGGLVRFRLETVRAELTHWLGLVPIVWLFLLVPPLPAAVNVAYALVANVPCIVIQRFNRGRLDRTLVREPRPVRGR